MTTYRWLTPPAPAAIALLQLEVSASHQLLATDPPAVGHCRFTTVLDDRGQAIDEVVVWRLQ